MITSTKPDNARLLSPEAPAEAASKHAIVAYRSELLEKHLQKEFMAEDGKYRSPRGLNVFEVIFHVLDHDKLGSSAYTVPHLLIARMQQKLSTELLSSNQIEKSAYGITETQRQTLIGVIAESEFPIGIREK